MNMAKHNFTLIWKDDHPTDQKLITFIFTTSMQSPFMIYSFNNFFSINPISYFKKKMLHDRPTDHKLTTFIFTTSLQSNFFSINPIWSYFLKKMLNHYYGRIDWTVMSFCWFSVIWSLGWRDPGIWEATVLFWQLEVIFGVWMTFHRLRPLTSRVSTVYLIINNIRSWQNLIAGKINCGRTWNVFLISLYLKWN